MSKENIKKRFRNWKTLIAIASLIGFLFVKAGVPEAKNFLDEFMPYLFAVGISLGIWTDHEDMNEKEL